MYGFILGFLVMIVGLLPHVSLAQLDLEELLTEPEAVEEKVTAEETTEKDAEVTEEDTAEATEDTETAAMEDVAPTAKDEAAEETEAESDAAETEAETAEATGPETKSEATEPEESAESILPEDIDEKPEAASDQTATAEPTKAETPAEDDFMAQYIDELSEQEQENSQAKEMRSNAMQLIMQKDNTALISDDDARELQERSAKIREEQKKLLEEGDNKETAVEEKTAEPEKADAPAATEPNKNAPFGLTWGASQEETAAAGFELEEVSAENMTNIFLIKNPRQKRAVFNEVTAVFGEQNHLYAVYAKTPAQADMPNAEKTLKLYHEYYAALAKKYGNAKQHYSPNKEHSTSLNEVGYDLFLQDLKEEKAFLYATFTDETLKVTLSIFADADAHGYITLDYENTQIQSQEKEENLNDLINDL